MSINTTKVNYNTLPETKQLEETDQFIIIRNGVPMRFCGIKECIMTYFKSTLKPYKDCDEAKNQGLQSGDFFVASSPNLMGAPEGTVICVP